MVTATTGHLAAADPGENRVGEMVMGTYDIASETWEARLDGGCLNLLFSWVFTRHAVLFYCPTGGGKQGTFSYVLMVLVGAVTAGSRTNI